MKRGVEQCGGVGPVSGDTGMFDADGGAYAGGGCISRCQDPRALNVWRELALYRADTTCIVS